VQKTYVWLEVSVSGSMLPVKRQDVTTKKL